MPKPPLPFPCPRCGLPTIVRNHHNRGAFIRRRRECPGCPGFFTRQNGGGEVLDCWVIPGEDRNGPEYRRKRDNYRQLRRLLEEIAPVMREPARVMACLERARMKTGVFSE